MARHREPASADLDLVLSPGMRSIGAFEVRRLLPHARRRSLGPWVFLDHFGPTELEAGADTDVRPHPHIGLATVSFLFEGAIFHRDSLGNAVEVVPGAVDLMSAGRGIVHSERTPERLRGQPRRSHGLQLWLALPRELEDGDPAFQSHPPGALPEVGLPGGRARVLIGAAYGAESPVQTPRPTLYVILELGPGAEPVALPEVEELGIYVVSGSARLGEEDLDTHELGLLAAGARPPVQVGPEGAVLALLGGKALDGPRHMFWNFVHSDRAVVEAAAERWRSGGFADIPGDPGPRIPLPG